MPLSRAQIPLTNPLALPDGGSVNTSNGANGAGGSINTSNSGGSINTSSGGGSILLNGFIGEESSSSGGSIDLRALNQADSNGGSIIATGNSGNSAGSINLSSGGDGAGGSINLSDGGGSIDTTQAGGSINTSQLGGLINLSVRGGSINLSGNNTNQTDGGSISATATENYSGGSLNMSGGANGAGGGIDTSNNGGSINTGGVGSIGFGISGTRTTLNGSATSAQTITLPNATGTLAIGLISASTALNFGSVGGNGDFADLTISLSGAETTDVVFVTCISGGRGATDGKLIFEAFVSATDTVTVRAHNPHNNAINPASYDFKVAIIKIA